MNEENKKITQDVIDRLLYCEEYKEALKRLNSSYNPAVKVKFTRELADFKFPLDKAI